LNSKTRQEKTDIARQLTGIMGNDNFRPEAAAKFSTTEIKPALQAAGHSGHGKVLLTF
jgi:hypothetical protein